MPTTTAPAAGTSTSSTLSEWAGPYVMDMLGKAKAIAETPYQTYQGPMTAGESSLQSKVFQGLGSLAFPKNLGQSFASPMGGSNNFGQGFSSTIGGSSAIPPYDSSLAVGNAPKTEADWNAFQEMASFAPGTNMDQAKANFMSGGGKNLYTGPELGAASSVGNTQTQGLPQQGGISGLTSPQASVQPSNIAQSYMNPYLQSVLDPQLAELRRQSQITQMGNAAKMTGAGAFGGSRQALMDAETQRNLMQEMNKTVGTGYANAYDKAMQQFNTEQTQAKTLADMMAEQGKTQRGIEQEGITADYNEFLAQRDYPMKQTQYLQSMLQGLPISTMSTSQLPQSGIGQLASTVGTLGSTYDLLKKLGVV